MTTHCKGDKMRRLPIVVLTGLLSSVRVEACGSLPNGHDVGGGAGVAMDKCGWIEENEV